MGGKAALLLVLGFSMIFLVFGHNFTKLTTRSIDNMTTYYYETIAYNIAASGANIAANEIFLDPTWNASGYQNIPFAGGTLDISTNRDTGFVSVTCVGSMMIGDSLVQKTIRILLRAASFSRYAYFCQIEGNIWWTNNDTIWGPFHTQDWMQVYRKPYFYGKATTKKGMKYYTSKALDQPTFVAGYSEGINQDLPDDKVRDFEAYADAGGAKFVGVHGSRDFYLEFKEDSLTYKTGEYGAETTVYIPDFASNGIIYAKEGNFHIKGVVKGKYTVAADGAYSDRGRVYLEDDIVYSDYPYSSEYTPSGELPPPNPDCHDLLGIVARNEVYIADNADNNNNINIHASIYSEMAGFGAENYATRGFDGTINLIGGIIQKKRQAVGTFGYDYWGHPIQTGFNKRYKYDLRLMYQSPPQFPSTDSYEVVSWYE